MSAWSLARVGPDRTNEKTLKGEFGMILSVNLETFPLGDAFGGDDHVIDQELLAQTLSNK